MKFKVGKYYMHDKGRTIAILGKVTTYKWGDMFVIEETDITGHGISCAGINEDAENWTEIGKKEFLEVFKSVQHI